MKYFLENSVDKSIETWNRANPKYRKIIAAHCSHVATIWCYFRITRFQTAIDLLAESPRNYYVDTDE